MGTLVNLTKINLKWVFKQKLHANIYSIANLEYPQMEACQMFIRY